MSIPNIPNNHQNTPFWTFLEITHQACSEYNIDQMKLAGNIYEKFVPRLDQLRLENRLRNTAPTIFFTLMTIKLGRMPPYRDAIVLHKIVRNILLKASREHQASPITTLITDSSLSV